MADVTEMPESAGGEHAARDEVPALAIDESRLAMMRRVKRLSVAERIDLLDRLCREQAQIAIGARRIR
jgi:hypothetical protein